MRVWAMTLGRSDAASEADQTALSQFNQTHLVIQTADAWQSAATTLIRIWEASELGTSQLDEINRKGLWVPLRDAFVDLWQAGGRPEPQSRTK